MVAISILALIALLSWRGIDGMLRAQASTQARADQVLAVQAGLAQWRSDLNAVAQQSGTNPIDWDGRVLRLTRRSLSAPEQGLLVVGWAQRDVNGQAQWLRWQSPPLRTRGELQDALQRVATWARTPTTEERAREIAILPINDWQIFYYRGNAWSNALSSAGTPANQETTLPDGVRLILSLPENHPLAGQLTLDWNRPTLSGGKTS